MLYKHSFNTISKTPQSLINHAFGSAVAHPMMPFMGLTTTTLVAVQTYKDKLYFAIERLMIPLMALLGPSPVDMPVAFQQVQSLAKYATVRTLTQVRPLSEVDDAVLTQNVSSSIPASAPIEIIPNIAFSINSFHNISANKGASIAAGEGVKLIFKFMNPFGFGAFQGVGKANYYAKPPEDPNPFAVSNSNAVDQQSEKIAENIVDQEILQDGMHDADAIDQHNFNMLKAETFYEFLKASLSVTDGLRSVKGCPDCSQMDTKYGLYSDLIFGKGLDGNISMDGLHTLRKVAMYFKMIHSLKDDYIWAKGSSYAEDDWSKPWSAINALKPAILKIKENMERILREQLEQGIFVSVKSQEYIEHLGEINFDYDDLWQGDEIPAQKPKHYVPAENLKHFPKEARPYFSSDPEDLWRK